MFPTRRIGRPPVAAADDCFDSPSSATWSGELPVRH